jgi:glycosyltransferase involved in cell wall biosynthesis
MKILFVSCEAERSRSAYSHRLARLKAALEARGIQTDYLSLGQQPFSRPILAQPLNLPFIGRKLKDCDFIHCGGNAIFSAIVFKPYTRAKVVHDVHGDGLSEAQLDHSVRKGLRSSYWVLQARIVDALACRYADYFLAVSKPLQQRLIRDARVPPERVALVRNGVDLNLFRQHPKSQNGRFVVCYAGGFQHWQGIDLLVSAVELLPKNGLRLKIVGFAEGHKAIRSSIAGRLGDKAELINRVSQSELTSQLAAADVLVIPRPSHPAVKFAFPTKFGEYLALGKPVIVSDVDETAALVRQHACGLVSKPDPASLAATIRTAAHLPADELCQMGQNARSLAEREFSWEDVGQKYAQRLLRWKEQ